MGGKVLSAVLTVLLLGVALPRAAADPKEEAVKNELKALEGTWDARARRVDGKDEPPPPGGLQLILSGAKYTVKVGGKVKESGSFVVDPGKTPKTIDLKTEDGKPKDFGIYELKGDELKFAFRSFGKDRPTDFLDKGTEVYVWKKAKQ